MSINTDERWGPALKGGATAGTLQRPQAASPQRSSLHPDRPCPRPCSPHHRAPFPLRPRGSLVQSRCWFHSWQKH